MRRVLILAGVVLTVAACGPVSPAALTVDGDEVVSRADLFEGIEEQAAVSGTTFDRTLPGTWPIAATAGRLTVIGRLAIVEAYLDDAGIEVTEAHRSAAEAATDPNIEPSAADDLLLTLGASLNALDESVAVEPVTEAEIEEAYAAAFPTDMDLSCSRHILVATEAEAEDALDQITTGDDFADVAAEVSTDPGSAANGGELGCAPVGSFTPAFDDAIWGGEVGDLLGPIETEFGFHVIEVLDRRAQVLDDVRPQIEAQLQSVRETERSGAVNALIAEAVEAVDIEIDPRFGTWDPAAATVVPPEGAFVPPLTGEDGVLTVPAEPAP